MSDQQAIAAALDAMQPQMVSEAAKINRWLFDRHQAEIVGLYRNDPEWGNGAGEGRAVLVATSGVPGAGKSSFVDSSLDRERYFRRRNDSLRGEQATR